MVHEFLTHTYCSSLGRTLAETANVTNVLTLELAIVDLVSAIVMEVPWFAGFEPSGRAACALSFNAKAPEIDAIAPKPTAAVL